LTEIITKDTLLILELMNHYFLAGLNGKSDYKGLVKQIENSRVIVDDVLKDNPKPSA